MMAKKNMWLRLLAVLLALGMLMGCLAGCDGNGNGDSDEEKKDKEKSELDELREDLEEHEYEGLLIYLDEDMEDQGDGSFVNEDETLAVIVMKADANSIEAYESMADMEISSAKSLRDACGIVAEDNDCEVIEKKSANGTPYIYVEMDGEWMIGGFYYADGAAWVVVASFEDEDMEDLALKYATISQIDASEDEDDKNEDNEDKDEDDEEQGEVPTPSQRLYEYEYQGLSIYLYEDMVDDGYGSYYNEDESLLVDIYLYTPAEIEEYLGSELGVFLWY